MPYRLLASTYSGQVTGTARQATGFDGTDTLTFSGAVPAAVGDCILVERVTAAADGHYLVVEDVSSTVKRVQPMPPNLGGLAGVGFCQAMARDVSGAGATNDAKVASRAVTSYPAANQVRSTGAQFVTRGVRRNDYVILGPGGAGSTNEGVHVVDSVIDEDNITVKTGTLSTAAPTGDTVIVAQPRNLVEILDETASTMAAVIAGATVHQPNWGPLSDYVASLDVEGAGTEPGVGQAYTLDGVIEIRFVRGTGSNVPSFSLQDEVLINLRAGKVATLGSDLNNAVHFNMRTKALIAAPPSRATITVGTRTGDRVSGRNGGLFYGVAPATRRGTALYTAGQLSVFVRASGVKLARTTNNYIMSGQNGSLPFAELVTTTWTGAPPSWPVSSAAGIPFGAFVVDSANVVDATTALVIAAQGADVRNLTVDARDASAGILFGDDARVAEILKSDQSVVPLYAVIASDDVVMLDPREDYPLSELAQLLFNSTGWRKDYTFNPRFVERAEGSVPAGNPISGLTVAIFSVDEVTSAEAEIAGSPFVTDAQGRIDTDGVQLSREVEGDVFSHRMVVEGPGFRVVNQVFQITAPFSGDVAVDFLRPDLEGELST